MAPALKTFVNTESHQLFPICLQGDCIKYLNSLQSSVQRRKPLEMNRLMEKSIVFDLLRKHSLFHCTQHDL